MSTPLQFADNKDLIVLRDLADNGPQTADEFVVNHRRYVNSWAPVFTMLRRAGLVVRTGERRVTAHGAMAFVITITEAGRETLRAARTVGVAA